MTTEKVVTGSDIDRAFTTLFNLTSLTQGVLGVQLKIRGGIVSPGDPGHPRRVDLASGESPEGQTEIGVQGKPLLFFYHK